MSFLTEAKSNARGMLAAWRYVPAHLDNLGKLSRKLIKLLLRAMATIFAIVACLAAPFLFWMAPFFVPMQRRARQKDEQARQKALASLTRLNQRGRRN